MTFMAPQTLFEDWQRRRERFLSSTGAVDIRSALLQILDHLMTRYRNSPESSRPPLFPLPGDATLNSRGAVIKHHLAKRAFSGVKTEEQARSRAANILGRLSKMNLQKDASAPGKGNELPTVMFSSDESEIKLPPANAAKPATPQQTRQWVLLQNNLAFGASPLRIITEVREAYAFGNTLPEDIVQRLYALLAEYRDESQIAEVLPGAELLMQCGNESVMDFAIKLWRQRALAAEHDPIVRKLNECFQWPQHRAQATQRVRMLLADDRSAVRIQAAEVLTVLGTLDDVGLLCDLLALPPARDEHTRERPALIWAIKTLANEGR